MVRAAVQREINNALRDPENADSRYLTSSIAIKPSVLFTYWMARKINNEEKIDKGTYISNAIEVFQDVGIAPDSAWPFVEAKVNVEPAQEALREAYNQKFIGDHYRITSTGQDCKNDCMTAISLGYGFVFGTNVDEDFLNWNSVDGPWRRRGSSVGGHALYACSYDEMGVRGPNSWGKPWGFNGFFYISWDQILKDETQDIWVVKTVPAFAESYLS